MRVLIGRDDVPQRRLTVRWLWEPRDMWVGVFTNVAHGFRLTYVCLVPCLPLVIAWRRSWPIRVREPRFLPLDRKGSSVNVLQPGRDHSEDFWRGVLSAGVVLLVLVVFFIGVLTVIGWAT